MKKFDICKNIENFYSSNKAIINSIVVYGACLFVTKKFGIKIPGVSFFVQDHNEPAKDNTINNPMRMTAPSTSFEQAVSEIWRAGVGASSNFTKENCADKIYGIVSETKNLTDSMLKYAITAMGKISQTSSSNLTKENIGDLITKLSKIQLVDQGTDNA